MGAPLAIKGRDQVSWPFLVGGLVLFGLIAMGCGSAERGPTPSEQAEPEMPHVLIGITQRITPYLAYAGPGRLDYTTRNREFTINLRSGGSTFATLEGKIEFAEDDSATVTVRAKADRPVRVEVLGMKDARVQPPTLDAAKIILPSGETTLRVTGVFESSYDY